MDSANPPRGAVLVTGTSSGIGRVTALRLDRAGFRVLAGVRRDEDGESLAAEASGFLTPLLLDVTDAAAVERAAGAVEAAVADAGLAGLVNNAGISIDGPLEFVDLAAMRRQFEVNVFGPVALTRALLPALRRARGRVVNVSSGLGRSSIRPRHRGDCPLPSGPRERRDLGRSLGPVGALEA